jgi:hypothetical protein
MFVTWFDGLTTGGARLPPFGKTLQSVDSKYIESMIDKAVNRFSKSFFF